MITLVGCQPAINKGFGKKVVPGKNNQSAEFLGEDKSKELIPEDNLQNNGCLFVPETHYSSKLVCAKIENSYDLFRQHNAILKYKVDIVNWYYGGMEGVNRHTKKSLQEKLMAVKIYWLPVGSNVSIDRIKVRENGEKLQDEDEVSRAFVDTFFLSLIHFCDSSQTYFLISEDKIEFVVPKLKTEEKEDRLSESFRSIKINLKFWYSEKPFLEEKHREFVDRYLNLIKIHLKEDVPQK